MATNDPKALTLNQLMEVVRSMPAREPSMFDSLYKPLEFMGMRVYERPPQPAKIELRDITLSDGAKLFTTEFRAEINGWLFERFGRRPDPFGDKIFMMSGFGLSVSPKHAVMLTNIA